MKKATLLAAAALTGLSALAATPSSAQVQFGIGPNGPNIQVGPDGDRRYERRIERRRYDDRATTGSIERCRTVIIREEDEYGDEVTRRVRRCR
jgi:hypothetical protein